MQASIRVDEIIYELDKLDGHDFEEAMATVFKRSGYQVTRGKLSNDEGRDLVLKISNEVVIVECKHQQAAVGRPVLQKFHSAIRTYPGASRGILVTTGSFSPTVGLYKNKVEEDGVVVECWDHRRLLEESRQVGVVFCTAADKPFFHLPWRLESELELAFRLQYLARLRSHPREVSDAVQVKSRGREIIPANLIEYSVSKRFCTTVGLVHLAEERGLRVHPVKCTELSPREINFLTSGHPIRIAIQKEIDGKSFPLHFCQTTFALEEKIRSEVGNRLTSKRIYKGANNVSYTRTCEVKSSDVRTVVKQVFYARFCVQFTSGPKKYEASLLDDIDRGLFVGGTSGFEGDNSGFILGNGFLCNDCGMIAPSDGKEAGFGCALCSRTLCCAHAWKWPDFIYGKSRRLCSSCYTYKNQVLITPLTISAEKNQPLAMLRRRLRHLRPLTRVWCLAVLTFLCFILVSCVTRRIDIIVSSMVLVVLTSSICARRHRCHLKNLRNIEKYRPSWQGGTSVSF